ncbi:MAG: chromate efflux transporter [Agriterribacter sp.]
MSTAAPIHNNSPQVTLRYLFFTFFKIGMVSFGGHMALVAVIKNIMVDKDKTLQHETILDAVGIGSLLPGPLAVNVVAYIGYQLKKTAGAALSMTAVILPASMAMLILSWAYFRFGYHQQFKEIMYYVTGAVSAIILSTGLQLYMKELKDSVLKTVMCAISIILLLITKNFLLTMACIIAGGIVGVYMKMGQKNTDAMQQKGSPYKLAFNKTSALIIVCLAVIVLLFITNVQQFIPFISAKIVLIFSGISLSLFGGGYVMIPIMQSLFVTDLAWLSQQEFLDAIAFSQSTPGPILVSATFIGYKLAGFAGALLATVAIFAPSAVLIILVSRVYAGFKNQPAIKNALTGIKAVVIGLIIGAAISIGQQAHWNIALTIITAIAFICSFRFKLSPIYIITASALAGTIIWFVSK